MMRIRSVSLRFVFDMCLILGALRGLVATIVHLFTEPASQNKFGLDLLLGIPLNAVGLGVAGVLLAWFYNRFGVRLGDGFVIEIEPLGGPSAKETEVFPPAAPAE